MWPVCPVRIQEMWCNYKILLPGNTLLQMFNLGRNCSFCSFFVKCLWLFFHVKKTMLFWSCCYWIFGLKLFSGFLCDNVNINVMVCVCPAASVVFHLRCVCSAGWGSKVRKPLSSDAQEKQQQRPSQSALPGCSCAVSFSRHAGAWQISQDRKLNCGSFSKNYSHILIAMN